jgi:flagellar assembly protein FliH
MGTVIKSQPAISGRKHIPVGVPIPIPGREEAPARGAGTILPAPISERASPTADTTTAEMIRDAALAGVAETAMATIKNRASFDEEWHERRAAELNVAKKEAAEEGYEDGRAAGREEAKRELAQRIDRLGMILEALEEQKKAQLEEIHDIVVEVVFAAVARIVGTSMVTQDGVASIVRQVLGHVGDDRRVTTIRLSPDDYSHLGADTRSRLAEHRGMTVDVVADQRVRLGGCLLDTDRGGLDGRLEIQLERLKESLLDARAKR